MTANDSDAPEWMVWLIVLSQVVLMTIGCAEQIVDGLRWVGLPIAAPIAADTNTVDADWMMQ